MVDARIVLLLPSNPILNRTNAYTRIKYEKNTTPRSLFTFLAFYLSGNAVYSFFANIDSFHVKTYFGLPKYLKRDITFWTSLN